jgi:nicotinamide riboside kinase
MPKAKETRTYVINVKRTEKSISSGASAKKNCGRKNRDSLVFLELQMSELKLRPPSLIYEMAFRPSLYPEAVHPAYIAHMKRVVILGRGASGKSTLAVSLGEITGLPVIELDKVFWLPGLVARRRDQWVAIQERLAAEERWIMDGDLGPYDAVDVRLRAADTILFLDFSLLRCAWRAIRRSRERADFWWWLLTYHWRGRPILMEAIANHAADADLHTFRKPEALRRFVAEVARESRPEGANR